MTQPRGGTEILMATFNSAAHLVPLLDSLAAQTDRDFRLVVSDDCSSDATLAILEGHAGRFRHPVRIIRRASPSGSAAANFASLMRGSEGDHVFLCDADDVWDADKVERLLALARREEAAHGVGTPLFAYSDARIIDGQGRLTHASYWRFKRIDPARCATLERLLVCPPMIGCASVMNRALVRLAQDVPVGRVTGHDWWAILVAALLGRVAVLPEPTISYRVHGRNSSRPKQVTVGALARVGSESATSQGRGRLGAAAHEVRRRLAIRRRQAEPLLEQFGSRLSPAQRTSIERFLALEGQPFLRRRLSLLRGGYTYPDPLRTLALLAFA